MFYPVSVLDILLCSLVQLSIADVYEEKQEVFEREAGPYFISCF